MRNLRRTCFAISLWFIATQLSAATETIRGTLTDVTGKAIAKGRIATFALEGTDARLARYRAEQPEQKAILHVVSGADGRFSLEVEKGSAVRLQFEADGFAPAGTIAASGEDIGAAQLRAAPAARTMVRYRGTPLAGARVVARGGFAELIATTGDYGTVSFPNLERWCQQVVVLADGKPVTRWTRSQGQMPLQFDIRDEPSVSGTVLQEDGKSPAGHAALYIDGWSFGETEDDGSFRVEHPPAGWKELLAIHGSERGRAAQGRSTSFNIRLAAGSSLAGRITDASAKTPVANALVELRPASDYAGKEGPQVVTDASGRYSIDRITAVDTRLLVTRPPYAPSSATTVGVIAGARTVRDIPLQKAPVLSGRVMDNNRRPVAGAAIAIIEPASGGFSPKVPSAFSDPAGSFVVRSVAIGPEIQPIASRSGVPSGQGSKLRLAAGEHRDNIMISLPSGQEVRGRVIDPDGKPLARVALRSEKSDLRNPWNNQQQFRMMKDDDAATFSAEDGSFTLNLEPGTYDLGARLAGYVTQSVIGIRVDPAAEPVTIRLVKGVRISGFLRRASGEPVADAGVSVRDSLASAAVTATDGSFTIDDLAPGESTLTAIRVDEGLRAQKKVTAPADGVIIEAPAGGTISGRVVEKETGAPITDFRAGISLVQPNGAQVRRTPPLWRTFSDPTGAFLLTNVPPEGVDVVVSAPGFVIARATGLKSEEAKPIRDLEIALHHGTRLSGTVTNAEDAPLASVFVNVEPKDSRSVSDWATDSRATTDADGNYSVEAIEPGEVVVAFFHDGYAPERKPVTLEGREQHLNARLSRGKSLAGHVTAVDGSPITDAEVSANSQGARGYATTTTDAAGAFRLEGLSDGRYAMMVQKSGFVTLRKKDLDPATTGVLALVLQRGSSLHGTVGGLTAKELQTTTIYWDGSGTIGEIKVGSDGRYRGDGVPTGSISAQAFTFGAAGERSSESKSIEISAGGDAELNFDFSSGPSVHGRITRQGRPLPSAEVAFQRAEPGQEGWGAATTADDGTYEVKGIPPGRYHVIVTESLRHTTLYRGLHQVTAANVDIDISQGVVKGRISDASDDTALEGAVITLERLETDISRAWNRPSVLTSSTGEFVIEGVGEGKYRLIAQKAHYTQRTYDVTIPGTAAVNLALEKSEGTKLKVFDARDGRALLASLAVLDQSGIVVLDKPAWTSSEEARLALPEGRYQLVISVSGYATRNLSIAAPGADLQVGMTPGGSLIIRSSKEEPRVASLLDGSGALHRVHTSELAGRWQLLKGESRIDNMEPGSYTLRITHADGKVDTFPVVVREGAPTTVDI